MRRAPLICALLAACLPAAAGARALPGAAAAGVRLTACVPALEQHERTATFEARVRQARGGERIQVRFTLQQREPASREWHRIVAEGLDEWQTSEAGVSRYSYAKTVQNLSAPAVYRVVVRFRWLDAGGTVLARARATSRGCRQPDMRPDLAATLIEPLPPAGAEPGGYLVILVNRGRSDAGAFAVGLRVGATELEPQAQAGLAAGEIRMLRFGGPACAPGAALTAAVDPGLAVDERDEDDNVLVAACPA